MIVKYNERLLKSFKALFADIFNQKRNRLFTVLYFSVRSSKSSALRYELPSCMTVKPTLGAGVVWFDFSRTSPSPPPPRAINPDARPLGTFENQDTRYGTDAVYLNDLTKK